MRRAVLPTSVWSVSPCTASHAACAATSTGVRAAGLEFTPVEQVAQAAWDAVHGERLHTLVGKTARRMWFAARFLRGSFRKQARGRG